MLKGKFSHRRLRTGPRLCRWHFNPEKVEMFKHHKPRLILAVSLLLGIVGFSLLVPSHASAAPPRSTQASSCTTSRPSGSILNGIADQIYNRVNQQRTQQGLQPLRGHPGVIAAARDHSINMARTGIFSHVINGQGPEDRLRAHSVTFTASGENIYASWQSMGGQPCWNVEGFAEQAVTGWMNSPGHRSNILNPRFNYTGVGIAVIARNGQGWFYTTQNFIQG